MNLKIEYNHTFDDFKKIEEIEKGYLAIETIAPSNQTMEWHNTNKDIHVGVRDIETREIVGSLAFVPLNKNQYERFIVNELEDTELNSSNMEVYEDNGEYYLLVSAITIQKEYRNNRYVLYLLLKGFYEKLLNFKNRNIKFINMCAEGQTLDAQKFIESFLNLKFHTKTKDNYNIYCYKTDYESFNNWLEMFPMYINEYCNRFKLEVNRVYKTETHLHTKESKTSISQKLSAKDIVKLYKEKGYNTIIVTDHYDKSKIDSIPVNNWEDKIEQLLTGYRTMKQFGNDLGINILLGIELTLIETDSDYLIYGITEEFLKEYKYLYNLKLEELVKLCADKGILIVQAHPFRDDIVLAPLEYCIPIEAFNGCHNEISRNDEAIEYAKQHNLIGTSGSDFHHINDTARGGIITKEEIKTIEDYIKLVSNNDFVIISNDEVLE